MASTARELQLEFVTWSYGSGVSNGYPPIKETPMNNNPLDILNRAVGSKLGSLFVLRDYHAFLKDAQIVRKLRDTIEPKSIYTPIVIISPVLALPIELEKSAVVIDYDLPSSEDIKSMITAVYNTIGKPPPDDVSHIVNCCRGLTTDEIEGVLAKSWVLTEDVDIGIINEEKKQIIRKSGILEYHDDLEEFTGLGGLDVLKDWLHERAHGFEDGAREFGLPVPKGALLLGIPGTGKTETAKLAANMFNLPLLELDVGCVMSGTVGSSEENMRKALRYIGSVSPCVVLFDEIDKGLSGVASSNFSDAGTTSRVYRTLLTWLQNRREPVFTIATANSVKELPPELLRKGRIDEIFYITLPNVTEMIEIIKIHLAKRGRNPAAFDVFQISREAYERGFTGAEIEQAIISAMFTVYSESGGKEDITTENIIEAMDLTNPLSVIMEEKIKELHNWCSTRARFASSDAVSPNFE